MLLISTEQVAWQPWNNSGGRTREMLARPTGGNWKLRVSLADIDSDGPFSAFPGVVRWFAVVQGAGVHLQFPRGEHRLVGGDSPFCFDGATAPFCSLIDGPTRDINLMVRTGLGAMKQVRNNEPWSEQFEERGLFTASGGRLHCESDVARGDHGESLGVRLEPYTLVWDLGHNSCRFKSDRHDAQAWWLGYSSGGA